VLNPATRSHTGSLNKRNLFLQYIKTFLEQSDRSTPFAIIVINLDKFNLVNYGMGYPAGDQLLLEVTLRLQSRLSADDIMLNLSADEFAILLSKGNEATEVVDKLVAVFETPFILRNQETHITASVGITYGKQKSLTRPDELLRNASIAMYWAKSKGGNDYAVFDTAMQRGILLKAEMERALRYAVQNNELRVFYQPIVAMNNGQFKGFEALVRWIHPEHGMMNPGEFLPLAEETGFICDIDNWVLNTACQQAKTWQGQLGPDITLCINVNISAKQFQNPDLCTQVKQALRESGLAARYLRLEFTEDVLMQNPEQAVRHLVQLKVLGVQLHLDDFGTGLSALSWLPRFPIDVLKVNSTFLGRMTSSPKTVEIVQAIVNLGHNLGMTVVAKGIETEEQIDQIKDLEFDYIQGYYLSEPLDDAAATNWITELDKVLQGSIY
jgi:diguanylate cyclase (GGDEF)-like protein